MLIIGCDYHPSFQQIAWVDTESGDCGEQRLVHSGGEAERYYRGLNGQGAGGDGSRGTRTLVRGVTGGVEVRAMGRRPGADSGQASAEAQERPRGCATPAQINGGRSLSPGVGAECRESGCAPTALAPAPAGADAHPGHESVAGHRPERRGAAQEGAVKPAGPGAIRDAKAS